MSLHKLLLLNEHCVQQDISLRQLALLSLLEKEDLKPTAIATRLNITTAAITGQLDALETKGLLVRQHQTGDRRGTLAHLTPTGLSLIQQASALAA